MVVLQDVARELDDSGLLVEVSRDADVVELRDVEHDSRAVGDGSLYCCVVGEHHDGHAFVENARRAGAVALLVSDPVSSVLPVVRVERSAMRRGMAIAARVVHSDPSAHVPVFGITGTNGKTTTAAFLAAILDVAQHRPRVFGTLTGVRTTPESTELQRSMRRAIDEGIGAVVMEVTSHALVLERTYGVSFETAIFTNLGHDHLDFHGTMDAYFEAKALLFVPGTTKSVVINGDDPHGAMLAERCRQAFDAQSMHVYGLADAQDLRETLDESSFIWGGQRIELSVGGRHNVMNALAAATAARAFGIDALTIARGLASVKLVPGRLQLVNSTSASNEPRVFVDYAHTPDSLEAVLGAVRGACSGRVLVVFGCGGDRDRDKRPVMGRVAAEHADVVVVTSDNPRSEDPQTIIDAVLGGVVSGGEVVTIMDRREAIDHAIAMARPGDVVVIAGKGHEQGQTFADGTVPFDDVEEARGALARRGNDERSGDQ
jgi:UDP-N-acetylmuramoyl-L-alanyl-D-glutamate--2,6-diaminopimelate ligase